MMMKCPSRTLIWLCMQPTWKQNLIVWSTLFDYGERLIHHTGTWHVWSHEAHPRGIICFTFYTLFCKGLEMMGNDKICTASCTYINVLSLCHLYPLPFTCRITNEIFQKILFSCNSSHNITLNLLLSQEPMIYSLMWFHFYQFSGEVINAKHVEHMMCSNYGILMWTLANWCSGSAQPAQPHHHPSQA
jgi:hypothetical protein